MPIDSLRRSTLNDGRQIFGRNLREIRKRHPVYNTQLEIARELNALGYPGYSSGSGGEAVIVTKKISKFERGTLTPPLPEAAAIARILNTSLDALTDTRGTVETVYDVADEAWHRFTDAVISFYNSFQRANSAIADFRTAQEELRQASVPLYAPEGVMVWNRLWGALSDEERANLIRAMAKEFGIAQDLKSRSSGRKKHWDEQLRARMDDAAQRLSGADLKQSQTFILHDVERLRRRQERAFMNEPARQLQMLDFLGDMPHTEEELTGVILAFADSEDFSFSVFDADGDEHVYRLGNDL